MSLNCFDVWVYLNGQGNQVQIPGNVIKLCLGVSTSSCTPLRRLAMAMRVMPLGIDWNANPAEPYLILFAHNCSTCSIGLTRFCIKFWRIPVYIFFPHLDLRIRKWKIWRRNWQRCDRPANPEGVHFGEGEVMIVFDLSETWIGKCRKYMFLFLTSHNLWLPEHGHTWITFRWPWMHDAIVRPS